jgi:conjugal transfer mating pair stabilization protein TraG
MQLSESLSQELAQWHRQQQVSNRGLDAPQLWAADLSPRQRSARQEMISRWLQEKQDVIRSEIAGDLHGPHLVEVNRPSIDRAADVQRSYHPKGTAGQSFEPEAGGRSR